MKAHIGDVSFVVILLGQVRNPNQNANINFYQGHPDCSGETIELLQWLSVAKVTDIFVLPCHFIDILGYNYQAGIQRQGAFSSLRRR